MGRRFEYSDFFCTTKRLPFRIDRTILNAFFNHVFIILFIVYYLNQLLLDFLYTLRFHFGKSD